MSKAQPTDATDTLLQKAFADCPLITAQETARLLGIDEKTLRQMATAGVIRTVIVGASTRRYTEADVRAFLAGERFGEVKASVGTSRSQPARSKPGITDIVQRRAHRQGPRR